MPTTLHRDFGGPPDEVAAPGRVQATSGPDPIREREQLFQTALEGAAQGLCLFDRAGSLVACNARFLEIYRVAPGRIAPGASLREVAAQCLARSVCSLTIDEFVALSKLGAAGSPATSWSFALNGRAIRVGQRGSPEGGWVTVHEEIAGASMEPIEARVLMSLQSLIDRVPDNLWVKDLQSRFVIANAATAHRIGLATAQDLIGKTDLDLCPPETAEKYMADEQEIIASGRSMFGIEEYILDREGAKTWISTTKVPMRSDDGQIIGIVGISRDVTERRRSDELRDAQAQVLETIAKGSPLATVLESLVRLVESQLTGITASVMLLDADGMHLRTGAAPNLPADYLAAIEGAAIGPRAGSCGTAIYRREPVIVTDIQSDPLWEDWRALAAAHGLRSCWSTPILSRRSEALGAFAMYSGAVRAPSAEETRLVEIATRIAGIAIERKLAEDRIHFLANHDALTGLHNRAVLKDRLDQALQFAKRFDRWASVAFIDLDNFKEINDSLGHNAGDELLKAIATRMVERVRATDTVMRMGGDEFVILLFDQPKNLDVISSIVRDIQAAIARPVEIDGQRVTVTSSIGIATYPADASDADGLLSRADTAMYRAKEVGRDNFQFYAPDLKLENRR